jgi:hypothetical protein
MAWGQEIKREGISGRNFRAIERAIEAAMPELARLQLNVEDCWIEVVDIGRSPSWCCLERKTGLHSGEEASGQSPIIRLNSAKMISASYVRNLRGEQA